MGNWGVFILLAITIIIVGLVILAAIGAAAAPKSDSGSGSSTTPVWIMPWWPSRETPMLGPGGERRYAPETPALGPGGQHRYAPETHNLGPGGEQHLLGPGGTFRYGKEPFADAVAPMPVPYSTTKAFTGSSEPPLLGKGRKEGFENFASF
jgi:hypothetical protein